VEPTGIDLIIETARRAADDANLVVEFMERTDPETALKWAKLATGEASTLVVRLLDRLGLPRDDTLESLPQHLQ
jgi:hypothetical protein